MSVIFAVVLFRFYSVLSFLLVSPILICLLLSYFPQLFSLLLYDLIFIILSLFSIFLGVLKMYYSNMCRGSQFYTQNSVRALNAIASGDAMEHCHSLFSVPPPRFEEPMFHGDHYHGHSDFNETHCAQI